MGSYKSDREIGSSSTEICEIERSPKLISDSIDQVSPLVARLSLEKTENELKSTPRCQSRLYGLELLSSSPHDEIIDLTKCLDTDEDVVLMEKASSGDSSKVALDDDVGSNVHSVLVVGSNVHSVLIVW